MTGKPLRVEVPKAGYRRLMTCNRYYIERLDGFLILHFALVNTSGVLLDRYACSISKVELEIQKKSLMDYLGKTGSLEDAPPAWQPPLNSGPIDLCNYIGLVGNPNLAEITLCNMAGRVLAEAKANSVVVADPIALLRCGIELQKHWIKDLVV